MAMPTKPYILYSCENWIHSHIDKLRKQATERKFQKFKYQTSLVEVKNEVIRQDLEIRTLNDKMNKTDSSG